MKKFLLSVVALVCVQLPLYSAGAAGGLTFEQAYPYFNAQQLQALDINNIDTIAFMENQAAERAKFNFSPTNTFVRGGACGG